MFAVPAETPVTTPAVATTVAIAGRLLVHVPPGVASESVVVVPTHIPVAPVMGDIGFTLTVLVAVHAPIAYVIKPVPLLTPVTNPVPAPIEIVVAELLHAPPDMASASVMDDPAHTAAGPLIAVGVAFTVIGFVAEQPVAPIV